MLGGVLLVLGCVAYATWTDLPSTASRLSLLVARLLAGAGALCLAYGGCPMPLAVELVGIGLVLRRPRSEALLTPVAAVVALWGQRLGTQTMDIEVATTVSFMITLCVVAAVQRLETGDGTKGLHNGQHDDQNDKLTRAMDPSLRLFCTGTDLPIELP